MNDRSKGGALSILILMSFMTGCGLVHVTKKQPEPLVASKPAPISASTEIVQAPGAGENGVPNNGSLWVEGDSRSFFFLDAKAGFVGDIVTVRVIENASGSKGAKTATARTSSVSASTTSLFGLPSDQLAKAAIGSDLTNSFDGDGSTSRSGSLTADVTAIVTKVFPNGNMEIAGRREVTINNEKEYLSISGIIRPEDIGPGNTVLSTVIADAKIEYSGLGVINDKQRPGWLMRLIDFVWPF